jgi:diaminohydroxyphosphoribosylaminopyrimidine deaminase/5-amino-6-(5-phosphoribosylamino)uracil reductase
MTPEEYVLFALSLAQKANHKDIKGNPFVGAIVVDEKGAVIGTGYHKIWGSKHAEVYAIEEALAHKPDLTKCSLYVTLEPCSHHGKTPPCTDLIVQSGIKKVFVGSLDPNPKVSGFELLKQKGIDIQLIELKEALELNKVFFTNQKKQKPFVAVKIAATIDGKIADHAGTSKWITNEQSRAYLHAHIRNQVDAIVSTAKTVIEDKATLNCRIPGQENVALNVVVIDRTGRMLQEQNSDLPIYYNRTNTQVFIVTAPNALQKNQLLPNSVRIIEIDFNANNEVNLNQLGKALLDAGLYHVLIEAGSMFSSYVLEHQWADELHYFIGSKILLDSAAKHAFTSTHPTRLSNSMQLSVVKSLTFKDDVYIHYKIDSL